MVLPPHLSRKKRCLVGLATADRIPGAADGPPDESEPGQPGKSHPGNLVLLRQVVKVAKMTMTRRWLAACIPAVAVTAMAILAGGDIGAADKADDENQSAASEPWQDLFSDGLVDADGERVSLDDLKGKLVGIYFSAHWCPPCKAFTPRLVAFRDKNAADFEVVFVSSDRTREGKRAYMKEANMKWPAVPFRSKSAAKLKADFHIRTLPTLIVLSPDGNTVSTSARTEITWTPKSCLKKWQAAADKADKE